MTAYLFDEKRGEKLERWRDALEGLAGNQVLWFDLADSSDDPSGDIRKALGIEQAAYSNADAPKNPGLEQHTDYLRITAVAVSDDERDPDRERIPLDCFVGKNWVLTEHSTEIAVLDDFRRIVAGQGEIGSLDAPTFLAAVMEWVVTSYLRAFDELEETLEKFDVSALKNVTGHPEEQIARLVEVRSRAGGLRRSLAPHRELFAALSHSEFDPISSEGSARRFAELAARVDVALESARDVKDGIASSFDVLIVRTEHRTNEIIKVLTIASILLLPGALLAGIAGMNVNFKLNVFASSLLFWVVVIAIVSIAVSTLVFARLRRWI